MGLSAGRWNAVRHTPPVDNGGVSEQSPRRGANPPRLPRFYLRPWSSFASVSSPSALSSLLLVSSSSPPAVVPKRRGHKWWWMIGVEVIVAVWGGLYKTCLRPNPELALCYSQSRRWWNVGLLIGYTSLSVTRVHRLASFYHFFQPTKPIKDFLDG